MRELDLREDLITAWYSSDPVERVAQHLRLSKDTILMRWRRLRMEGAVPDMQRNKHHHISHPNYNSPVGPNHDFKLSHGIAAREPEPGDRYDGRPSVLDDPLLTRLRQHHKLVEP